MDASKQQEVAIGVIAEFRKLADAKEYEFNTDPECNDDSFETLRYCADVLELRLNGNTLPLGGDWIERHAALLHEPRSKQQRTKRETR